MAKVGSTGKTVLYIAGAVVAVVLFSGYTFLKNSIISYKPPIGFGGTILQPEIYLTLNIINASPIPITIDNIIGDITYKNNSIAKASTAISYQIDPGSNTDIEVRFLTTYGSAVTVLQNAITGNIINQIYFKGSVVIDNIPVPVNELLI